jgi:hypothetical protein
MFLLWKCLFPRELEETAGSNPAPSEINIIELIPDPINFVYTRRKAGLGRSLDLEMCSPDVAWKDLMRT